MLELPRMYESDEEDMRSKVPQVMKSSQREEWAGKEGKHARGPGR
jgi:hypothetical protein